MCGIAGLIERARRGDGEWLRARAQRMADAIAYRGPDGAGVWCEAEAGVALSHRRLAIIDLTPSGAQPMAAADGRWVISYNGEVYNAQALATRADMAGVNWRGHSDTEVIVESIARRGLDATLADLNGMFAIALWDRDARTLHLVRDRLGIKPLFYVAEGGRVRFASELRALHAAADRLPELDLHSVSSFLRFGYVPAPFSIFQGIAKVMPGEIVSIDGEGRISQRRYWSMDNVVEKGKRDPLVANDDNATDALHDLLADAVSGQMISDVPLGVFLSGGIDSSTVAALMTAAEKGPVRTFSIGFSDLGFDESRHAAAVARHLGTDHEELIVGSDAALDLVPSIPDLYDEPFADSSQIPTHLLSKLTRQHVTVALSGDGGDELFGGYNRYLLAETLIARLTRWPVSARRAAAAAMRSVPGALVDGLAGLAPARLRIPQAGDKLKKFSDILPSDAAAIYLRLVSQCPEPVRLLPTAPEHPLPWSDGSFERDCLSRMQAIDAVTYLPDDILQKVDRASMAVALEVRPPLLDHRVVEFAMRLPRHMRIRNRETKWLLRRVLDRYVPRQLIERPKMGFGIPLASWLRGPLREWAADLLSPQRFAGSPLDRAAAKRLFDEHVGGRRNWAYALWTVLMFEAWRHRWMSAQAP